MSNEKITDFELASSAELRERYGLTAENRSSIRLDPRHVPEGLRHLIPMAERFGVSDDLIRQDVVARTSSSDLHQLQLAVLACDDELDAWLAGPEAELECPTDEYIAFTCLRMAVDGA
jgi:hypothetical protein